MTTSPETLLPTAPRVGEFLFRYRALGYALLVALTIAVLQAGRPAPELAKQLRAAAHADDRPLVLPER